MKVKKLKKIVTLILILIIVIIIYIFNIDKNIYYVSLGDSFALGQDPYNNIGFGYSDYVNNYLKNNNILEKYTKEFAKSDYRIVDVINDINNNVKIDLKKEKIGLKSILQNADLVTLSIGSNEIYYKLGITNKTIDITELDSIYKYIDETMNDLNKLIKLIRDYFQKDLIIIGYYNPLAAYSSKYARELEPIFNYINNKGHNLIENKNTYYVDIYEIFKENSQYLPNPKDIHPSNKGYQAISSNIIDIIEKNIIN